MNLRKPLTWGVFAMLTMISPWIEAHPDVKAFVQTTITRNWVTEVMTSQSFCNFSLVEIDGHAKFMTARHCVDNSVKSSDPHDIILLDQLPPRSRSEDITDAHIHTVSPYMGREISGKTLTIKGFLPTSQDHSVRKMYTIRGKSRYNTQTGNVDMVIAKADFENMLQSVGRECRMGNYYLSGMSGGVVLDDQGRAFGVISKNEIICARDQNLPIIWVNDKKTTYSIVIAPLQDFLQKK